MKNYIFAVLVAFGVSLHSSQENSFPYASVGIGTVTPDPIPAIGLGVGYRHIFGLSALDANGGVLYPFDKRTGPIGCPIVQAAYLIYLERWSVPYFGAGGALMFSLDQELMGNVVVMGGYQTKSGRPKFIQVECSPFMRIGITAGLAL